MTEMQHLYPVVPNLQSGIETTTEITAALDAIVDSVAAVLVPAEVDAALVAAIRARGVPVILDGSIAAARALGADGVELALAAEVAEARRALGAKAMIGVRCGLSKDAGFAAADVGADYVAFGPAEGPEEEAARAELLDFWRLYIETPCVALEVDTLDAAPALIDAGADFVRLTARGWGVGAS